jgi:hypothetical protein
MLRNVSGTRTTVTWGYENELLVAQTAASLYTMTYDGDLLRRKRVEGATVWNFLWDGAQVLIETGSNNVTKTRYTLAPRGYGDLLTQRKAGVDSWYHFDALGTTRALTNSSGTVTDTGLHYAFGSRKTVTVTTHGASLDRRLSTGAGAALGRLSAALLSGSRRRPTNSGSGHRE